MIRRRPRRPARVASAGGGSDKRGSVNLMSVGMAVDADGSTVGPGPCRAPARGSCSCLLLGGLLGGLFLRSAQ